MTDVSKGYVPVSRAFVRSLTTTTALNRRAYAGAGVGGGVGAGRTSSASRRGSSVADRSGGQRRSSVAGAPSFSTPSDPAQPPQPPQPPRTARPSQPSQPSNPSQSSARVMFGGSPNPRCPSHADPARRELLDMILEHLNWEGMTASASILSAEYVGRFGAPSRASTTLRHASTHQDASELLRVVRGTGCLSRGDSASSASARNIPTGGGAPTGKGGGDVGARASASAGAGATGAGVGAGAGAGAGASGSRLLPSSTSSKTLAGGSSQRGSKGGTALSPPAPGFQNPLAALMGTPPPNMVGRPGVGAGAGAGAGARAGDDMGPSRSGGASDGADFDDDDDMEVPKPQTSTDLDFERNSRGPDQVKGGSLAQLVSWLAYYISSTDQGHETDDPAAASEDDLEYADIFFTMLPTFTDVRTFGAALREFYDNQSAGSRACRRAAPLMVAAVIQFWMSRHVHRLSPQNKSVALDVAESLLVHVAAEAGAGWATGRPDRDAYARSAVTKEMLDDARKSISEAQSRAETVPALPNTRVFQGDAEQFRSVWEVPPAELGRQLTYMDLCLFQAIPLAEFLAAGWDRPRYEHTADCIRRFIDRVNALSLWVQGSILEGLTAQQRANVIVRFVNIAKSMRAANNFAGLWAIITGLTIETVSRLEDTWALVPPDAYAHLDKLKTLFNSSSNHSAYQAELAKLPPDASVVPLLAAHTKELTINFDLHSDGLPGKEHLIHFKKLRVIYRILKPLLELQSRGQGDIQANRVVCNLLSSSLRPYYHHFTEDRDRVSEELMRRSKELEPDVVAPPHYDDAAYDGYGYE